MSMSQRMVATLLAAAVAVGASASFALTAPSVRGTAAVPVRVHGVSIDPADHLAEHPDASELARTLVERLSENRIDTVYVNAYNVEYGAYYETTYRLNQESELGRQDFLGKFVSAAHARGIRVVAALYDHQHRGAWETHPEWREKTASGGDYNPPGTDIQYYLSTGNPGATAWWRGFLEDILRRYPDLDGVELREPIVNWWGTDADYNPAVTAAFRTAHPRATLGDETWRRFRQAMLTRFLKSEIALVHRAGLFVHVTTVATTGTSGSLMPAGYVAHETGFDLDALLRGRDLPDALKVELIWQQWARLYGRVAFTPEWTGRATLEFLREMRGRAPVIVHVELTDFGRSSITVEEFHRTLRAADRPGLQGVDFYSVSLADAKRAWPAVRAAYGEDKTATRVAGVPHDHRVLVLHDRGGPAAKAELPLRQLHQTELLNLLEHFDVRWDTHPVDAYRRGGLLGYDVVVYIGSLYGNVPAAFLSDISVFEGNVVWIGSNLYALSETGVRLAFVQPSQLARTGYDRIAYRGMSLRAWGEAIPTQARGNGVVAATLSGPRGSTPYILRSGRFWYVAGSPFSYLEVGGALNGRYLAFADILHDALGAPHRSSGPEALLRIVDVDPTTSPDDVRAITKALERKQIPFALSVTPFYGGASGGLALSDEPRLAAALRNAVAHGGAIVLDGAEHRYRGVTGRDAEFWDLRNHGGVAEDSAGYVESRLEEALAETWAEDLHPLAWETPESIATPFDYALFAQTFSTFVERRAYATWSGDAYRQPLPYRVENDVFGGRIVPDNLGSVDRDGKGQAQVLANARRLLAVRDGTAGVSISIRAGAGAAATVADRLHRLGYRFLDLYTLPNVVTSHDRVELTSAGLASVPVPSGWTLWQRLLNRDGSVVRETSETFVSYARPARTFSSLPHGTLLSLRAVPSGNGSLPRPPGGVGSIVVTMLAVIATAGAAVLIASYVLARAGAHREAAR